MNSTTPDPVMRELIGLVVGLVERMHAHFANVTAAYGLSPMEGRALFLLDEPMPMGGLADTLRCDASYITGITNRLEEQGLVERQVHTHDRRVKRLVRTPKGNELREAMLLRTERDLPATVGLSSEQREALRDLLRISQRAASARSPAIPEP